MTPPFSSPGVRAFRQASPKKRARRSGLEIKIQSKFGYVLGAVLGRKSGQHGSNLVPKMEPKTAKNREKIDAKSIEKSIPFKIDVLCDFGGFWVPSWSQVGTQIEEK